MIDRKFVANAWISRAKSARNNQSFINFMRSILSFMFVVFAGRIKKTSRKPGRPICDCDWDNLIIFDSCRYDQFCQVVPGYVDTELRISRGSNTVEFLFENFEGVACPDTVYITANAQYVRLLRDGRISNMFHDVVYLGDEWDQDLQSISPRAVVRRALEVSNKYPNKRLIIHFVQPHYPFIGPKATQIKSKFGKSIGRVSRVVNDGKIIDSETWHFPGYTQALEAGIAPDEIKLAYRESIKLVFSQSEKLIRQLEGKSVITADHGEHLGERPIPFGRPLWGHPPGLFTEALRFVPWAVFNKETRKEVDCRGEQDGLILDVRDIDDHLSHLGYNY